MSTISQELPTNLIVNYIPREFTDELLQKLFVQFGEIESARIIRDKLTNETKGYGFVKFVSGEAAAKAMQTLNGFEILGKRLKLSYSHHNKAPIPQASPAVECAVATAAAPTSPLQLQGAQAQPMLFVLPRPLSPAPLQFMHPSMAAPLSPSTVSEADYNETPAPHSPINPALSPRLMSLSPAMSPSCMPLVYPQLMMANSMPQMQSFDPRLFQFGSVPMIHMSALSMM